MSAYSCEDSISLSCVVVNETEIEIVALLKLLYEIEIKDSAVTVV